MIIDEYQTFKGGVADKRASVKEKVKRTSRSKVKNLLQQATTLWIMFFSIESKFAAAG